MCSNGAAIANYQENVIDPDWRGMCSFALYLVSHLSNTTARAMLDSRRFPGAIQGDS